MPRNRSLAFKLGVLVVAGSGAIFLLMFGYSYWLTQDIIVRNVQYSAELLAVGTVSRVQAVLAPVEQVPRGVARVAEEFQHTEEDIDRLLRSAVENNPDAYGACLAFEPYGFDAQTKYLAIYAWRNEGKLASENIGNDAYQYFFMDWFQVPRETGAAGWIDPYYDEGGGNILMATYSVPFYRDAGGKREYLGVATADISMEWLSNLVSSLRVLDTGFAFLVSSTGMIITHPNKDYVMNETIFSLAEDRGDAQLRRIGREMVRGRTAFVPSKGIIPGRSSWVYYAPIPLSGWSLAVVYPEDELFAGVNQLKRTGLTLGSAGLVILLLVTILIARSVASPLRALALSTQGIAAGNLDAEVPDVKSRDEVGMLARSFVAMQASLKEYIRNLRETTAAKERIESELKIAREIQMSILPTVFPPFPNYENLELFAKLEPAREVSGDFYDFAVSEGGKVWFAIGDVSGKGVPASLFMAVTKTLLKVIATRTGAPDEILTSLNADLCHDNESGMFVTLFFGVLDYRTGELVYSNGGHNPPYFVSGTGVVKPLLDGRGRALGVMEDSVFRSGTITLAPGDVLFLYTDGVTEAMNAGDELFTSQRLEFCLQRLAVAAPREMISEVIAEVAKFVSGAPQSDDITAMALSVSAIAIGSERKA